MALVALIQNCTCNSIVLYHCIVLLLFYLTITS